MPTDIIAWSKGTALVATGLPIPPVDYAGVRYWIGQANNALLYPGLGLGTIVSGASKVTDAMLLAAAEAVAGQADVSAPGASLLPRGGEPARLLGDHGGRRGPGRGRRRRGHQEARQPGAGCTGRDVAAGLPRFGVVTTPDQTLGETRVMTATNDEEPKILDVPIGLDATGMRQRVRQPGRGRGAGEPVLGRADPAQPGALQHRPRPDAEGGVPRLRLREEGRGARQHRRRAAAGLEGRADRAGLRRGDQRASWTPSSRCTSGRPARAPSRT